MINIDRLCKGCMREIADPGGVCPICGYDNRRKENRSSKCLREHTILNGRYLLGRVLGEGGFGITYLAVDLSSERVVAIKEYFPAGLSNRETGAENQGTLTILPGEAELHFRNGLERFTREGAILSRFQDLPGIVNARDFFFANETAYLVMDYIEGQSLKQYMKWYQQNQKGEPMDYRVAIAFLEPVIQSMIRIHNAGLIHRDISPDNILVDDNGKITLIDFGSAREDRGTDFYTMTVMVKHGYAPEEQYRTHGKQGTWTDVYALCATLYHMISGTLPMEAVERLYQDNLVPLKNMALKHPVPETISDILNAGMAVRYQDRIQDMEQLWNMLSQALAQQDAQEAAALTEAARQQAELEAEARRQEELRAEASRQAKLTEAVQQQAELEEEARRQEELRAELKRREEQLAVELKRQEELRAELKRQEELAVEKNRQKECPDNLRCGEKLESETMRQKDLQDDLKCRGELPTEKIYQEEYDRRKTVRHEQETEKIADDFTSKVLRNIGATLCILMMAYILFFSLKIWFGEVPFIFFIIYISMFLWSAILLTKFALQKRLSRSQLNLLFLLTIELAGYEILFGLMQSVFSSQVDIIFAILYIWSMLIHLISILIVLDPSVRKKHLWIAYYIVISCVLMLISLAVYILGYETVHHHGIISFLRWANPLIAYPIAYWIRFIGISQYCKNEPADNLQ